MTKVSQWRVARYLLSWFCVLMVPTIINSAETQHSFQLLGITPVSESPDELVARISCDFQKWKEARERERQQLA